MPEIFVSHNREDLKIAQSVVDGLIAEGFNVWMDQNLQAGENYDEITEDRLHRASAVVVLWSSRQVKSRWVRAEATIGARKNTLVPLMIEECDRPVMFELIQTTDLSKWQGDRNDPAWLAFIEVIKKRLAATPAPFKGSESRGGRPAAVMLTFIFGMVSAAGIYIRARTSSRPSSRSSRRSRRQNPPRPGLLPPRHSLPKSFLRLRRKLRRSLQLSPSSRRPPSLSWLLSANAIYART